MSVASFYLASEREIALLENPSERPRFSWRALRRLPLVMSMGIGLCVNQSRAVLEALGGRETEFVRTPKHGIRGGEAKSGSWFGLKYRSAKSITPFIEVAMAAYFVVAIGVALRHGHYLSLPFLGLFLYGFGYVGLVSLWQGRFGAAVRGLFGRPHRSTAVVPPHPFPVMNPKSQGSDVLVSDILADSPLRVPETIA